MICVAVHGAPSVIGVLRTGQHRYYAAAGFDRNCHSCNLNITICIQTEAF